MGKLLRHNSAFLLEESTGGTTDNQKTGSFFGILALEGQTSVLIASMSLVGGSEQLGVIIPSGSTYDAEFTSIRIASGSALIYKQSTD
jgi:hypothetical protein